MAVIPDLSPAWSYNVGWFPVLVGLCLIYIVVSRIYSAFLSPLSKYPGPRLWAMTTIPYDIHLFRGELPYRLAELHEKYGPMIRIAPNQLSYITEDAWNDIYGKIPGKPQLVKKPFDIPRPPKKLHGLFTAKTDADHARMRRNFSHAFSDKAVREQEAIMKKYFDLLIQRLNENCTKPIDIVQWYNSTTFDIIGDLVFGESYQCLEKSRLHMWVAFIFDHTKVMMIMGLLKRISPLDTVLLWMLPKKMKESGLQFREFHAARVYKRLEWDTPRLDLMSHAQKAYGTPEGMQIDELRQTCGVLVVAGSETTATLLTGVTYLLCKNPESYGKLVAEIRQAFESEDQINITTTSTLKYLSAVLEEALRFFPPIPGSQNRITPSSGHFISSQYVPGNTLVAVNQWAANHSSLNFTSPYKFIPERWLGDEKYKDDKRKVVQPFGVGPRNCIGQNMAWAEMRVILARILWNFDIGLCEESEGWMGRLVVYTLWKKEPLMVQLTPVVREAKA